MKMRCRDLLLRKAFPVRETRGLRLWAGPSPASSEPRKKAERGNVSGAPLISVLIDTYNYGCFIEQAIESVLTQDVAEDQLEVVVVDDGSSDDTARRVEQYGARIRYFFKTNGGQGSAFNYGLARVTGEFVALLDADDYFLPGKLRRLLETFDAHPEAGMIYHRFPRLMGDTIVPAVGFEPLSGFLRDNPQALAKYRAHQTSSLAFRSSLLREILPIPESIKISADGYLELLAVLLAPVQALCEDLAVYRIHHNNLFAGYYQASDEAAASRLVACMQVVHQQALLWVGEHRDRVGNIDAGRFLDGLMLLPLEQLYRFQEPSRLKYFAFLLRENRVFAPLQPRWRSFLRYVLALSALMVGYRGYGALHAWCARQLQTLYPHGN